MGGKNFYAVKKGKRTGIFLSCELVSSEWAQQGNAEMVCMQVLFSLSEAEDPLMLLPE
jgi:hypothetical protein